MDRRTCLLRESVVHENKKSQIRESQRYVEERLYSSVVTLKSADSLLLATGVDSLVRSYMCPRFLCYAL